MSQPDNPPQTPLPDPLSQPYGQCIPISPLPQPQPEPVVPQQNSPAPQQDQPYVQCIPISPLPQPQQNSPALQQDQTYVQYIPLSPLPQPDVPQQNSPAHQQDQPYAVPAVPPLILPVGVPPGLQYLTMIDQVLIHQKMECIEIFFGFETNNQYEIKNSVGQLIFMAKEKNNCFKRNLCGPARSFQIRIKDNLGQEVMRVLRPFRCNSCLCPCCLQELEVQAPPGVPLGYVKQNWHPFLPIFTVQGPDKKAVMKIRGPYLPCKCCGDINFEVKGTDGQKPFGRITKQRGGILRKCFTDATNFTVQFPLDMDVKMKAVLIGACFLLDFMFFEKGGGFYKLLM